jgi:hypothetical protein
MKNAPLTQLLTLYEAVTSDMQRYTRIREGQEFGILVDTDEYAVKYQRRHRLQAKLKAMIQARAEVADRYQAPADMQAVIHWHAGPEAAPESVMLLVVCRLLMGNRMLMGHVKEGVWRMLVGNGDPYGRDELYVPADRIQLWAELPMTPAQWPVYRR